MSEHSATGDLLNGIRVLDFTLAAVGPFCSRILCDLGAEVIHVEWPRLRWAAADPVVTSTRFVRETEGGRFTREVELFMHGNGGKKSLAVNLKSAEGIEIVKSLLPTIDVVVENMTPRVMRSFGLDYESLMAINPRLVACSLSGFGQDGLDGDLGRPCTDPVAQAMSGISWLTGERNGSPYAVGGGLGDTVTSALGAIGIVSALLGRERTGFGQYLDLSMVESLAYLDCIGLPAVAMSGRRRVFRNGQQNSYTFPMGPFRGPNGSYVSIQAPGSGADSPWGRLCGLMGRPELVTDPEYASDEQRLNHVEFIVGAVEDWLCSLPDRDVCLALLAAERISAGPVLSHEEMLSHPFFAERGMFGTVEYPGVGSVRVVEPPFKYSSSVASVRGRAPELGEHTREVLGALGIDDERIDQLIAADVLREWTAPADALG